MDDLIKRSDAIDFITKLMDRDCAPCDFTEHDKIAVICYQTSIKALSALPASEYEEADGVITIEKQSAKDVGEIKHIIIRSPNYTRYFYNESMQTSADAEWIPCSERLPLVSGEFLVTLVDHDGTWVSTAQWNMTFGGRWQDIFPNDGYRDISNVIAWKTLPKPYTKGDNE